MRSSPNDSARGAPPATAPAFTFAATRDWPGYFAAVAGKPPRETLLDALARFDAEPRPAGAEPRFAIDLGCGEGRDAAELARRGWRVLAIDGHPEALRLLSERSDIPHRSAVTTRMALLEDVDLPPCDLLNASFTLPFCAPDRFTDLWLRVRGALRPGARFAGQLFGDRDGWAKLPDRSHQSRERALELLSGLEVERFDEEERDGEDASCTPKHWHLFHVVARRPGAPSES